MFFMFCMTANYTEQLVGMTTKNGGLPFALFFVLNDSNFANRFISAFFSTLYTQQGFFFTTTIPQYSCNWCYNVYAERKYPLSVHYVKPKNKDQLIESK